MAYGIPVTHCIPVLSLPPRQAVISLRLFLELCLLVFKVLFCSAPFVITWAEKLFCFFSCLFLGFFVVIFLRTMKNTNFVKVSDVFCLQIKISGDLVS